MADMIPFAQPQDVTDPLGVLQHNTSVRNVQKGEFAIEPRPNISTGGASGTLNIGEFGRGCYQHRGMPLYVSDSEINNSGSGITSMFPIQQSPYAAAAFSNLDDGSDRQTIIQNAGYLNAGGTIWFNVDGLSWNISIYSETLSNNFDFPEDNQSAAIAGVGVAGVAISGVAGPLADLQSFVLSDTGQYAFVMDGADDSPDRDTIYSFVMSSTYNLDTMVYTGQLTPSALETGNDPILCDTSFDGTRIYLNSTANNQIVQYDMSTPYDLSTAVFDIPGFLDYSAETTAGGKGKISPDGLKFYVIDGAGRFMYEYDLSPAYDLTSGTYSGNSLDLSGEIVADANASFVIGETGSTIWVMDDETAGGGDIYQYTMATPYNLSTATYDTITLSVGTGTYLPTDMDLRQDTGDLFIAEKFAGLVKSYEDVGGPWVQVTDVDSPGVFNNTTMIRGVETLNGYVFASDVNGNIRNCNNGDITNWEALSTITAEREPDFGCFLFGHHDHIGWLGTRSMEFFYDAQITNGSPLARRQDIYHSVGCVFPNSCVNVGDTLYFFGTDQEGDTDLYMLKNFQLTPLGNQYIKTLLRELDINTFVNPYPNSESGFKEMLTVLTTVDHGVQFILTINGKTYCFSKDTGVLSKWYPGDDQDGSFGNDSGMFGGDWATNEIFPIISAYTSSAQDNQPTVMLSNGYYGIFQPNALLRDIFKSVGGTVAPCFFYLPKWNANTLNRKKITKALIHQYPTMDNANDPSDLVLQWINMEDNVETGTALDASDFTGGQTIPILYSHGKAYRHGITRERIYKAILTSGKGQLLLGMELEFDILRG